MKIRRSMSAHFRGTRGWKLVTGCQHTLGGWEDGNWQQNICTLLSAGRWNCQQYIITIRGGREEVI